MSAIYWSTPRFVIPSSDAKHASLLFITIDCLRADRLGTHGYERDLTPHLDRLAKDGVRFAEDKPLRASLGETQIWTVTNKTKWSHPFHLHGFSFQLLDDKGAPVRPLAWKDTVDVPLEQTVRFVVRIDDRAGSWMYHCHILDHADGGMMGMLELGGAHGHGGTSAHVP